MNYLFNFYSYLNQSSPIIQAVVGTAIFGFLVWFGRFLYRLIINQIKFLKLRYESNKITKIIIHKHYVSTTGLYFFTQGFFIIIQRGLFNIIKSFIIIIFGFTLYFTTVNSKLILLLFIYVGIQYLFEALSWLDTRLASKDLSKYNSEIVKISLDNLVTKPLNGLLKSKKSEKKEEISQLKEQVDKLYKEIIGEKNNST